MKTSINSPFHATTLSIALTIVALAGPVTGAIIRSEEYDIDFGSVILSSLRLLDMIDLARLVAPRRLLFCAPKDLRVPWAEAAARQFKNLGDLVRYAPGETVNPQSLLEWLAGHSGR